MAILNLQQFSLVHAGFRAMGRSKGKPYIYMPVGTMMSVLVKYGGLTTLLDADMMATRITSFSNAPVRLVQPPAAKGKPPPAPVPTPTDRAMAQAVQSMASYFFYKLVDGPGYVIHSELMAYLSEPGNNNGVMYSEGIQPSTHIPAAFTFVGQFIDHDLTMNAMNLTVDQRGVPIMDGASPLIDLDHVYGPRPVPTALQMDTDAKFFEEVFYTEPDAGAHAASGGDQGLVGQFRHCPVHCPDGRTGYDLPRAVDPTNPNNFAAYIYDNRNDENQLILQIHILVQRFHNRLIKNGVFTIGPSESVPNFVDRVRKEVVATWQSFVLNEYMPAIIDGATLNVVLTEIAKRPSGPPPADPTAAAAWYQEWYGKLKHKPYRDLVTGLNVVRMPHEFALGFRFGHSQLRPFYVINEDNVVLLFKDARARLEVTIDGKIPKVSGRDDLRGGRRLTCDHLVDWEFFYPPGPPDPTLDSSTLRAKSDTLSMMIDHLVTARVFNLPESAIPDDIKYIGNLPHRNLIRMSQIGVVSGEELARFYGLTPLSNAQVLGDDAGKPEVAALFRLDLPVPLPPELPPGTPVPAEPDPCRPQPPMVQGKFKTPLWYYILREAEVYSKLAPKQENRLGPAGGRLVAEVLAGGIYYGNDFPFDDNWKSTVLKDSSNMPVSKIMLQQIIDYATK